MGKCKGLTPKQVGQLCKTAEYLQVKGYDYEIDDVLFIEFMRICRDYVTPSRYPLIRYEERKKWLIERLNTFGKRYFGKI